MPGNMPGRAKEHAGACKCLPGSMPRHAREHFRHTLFEPLSNNKVFDDEAADMALVGSLA